MVFWRKFLKTLDFMLISGYNIYIALKGKSIFLIRSESRRWVQGGKEELCSHPGAVREAKDRKSALGAPIIARRSISTRGGLRCEAQAK